MTTKSPHPTPRSWKKVVTIKYTFNAPKKVTRVWLGDRELGSDEFTVDGDSLTLHTLPAIKSTKRRRKV